MKYIVSFHPLVEKEYTEAVEWYEKQQKGLGNRFIEAVGLKMNEISQNPNAFGKKSSIIFREAKISKFPYLIVYKASEKSKEILVVSIHHTKKHPRKKYRK
jgi:mRNA-degrading endonuclease RelE of RelBE toxin-antitoxin system